MIATETKTAIFDQSGGMVFKCDQLLIDLMNRRGMLRSSAQGQLLVKGLDIDRALAILINFQYKGE